MKKIAFLGLVACAQVGLWLVSPQVRADESRCMDLAKMRAMVVADKATWIDLTQDQWSFLRTISFVSPATAPGFPYGTKAALARNGDKSLAVFIDGTRACDIMPVSQAIVNALNDVADVQHEPPQGEDQ